MRDYAELVKSLRYYGAFEQHAKEAADAIEEQHKRADELGEELTSAMELVHKRNEKIEKLQSELVTTRNKLPRWISVEERLPEKHKVVLFYIPWNKTNMIGWIDEGGGINLEGYGKCYDFSLIKPSHWMPLPEPPKEDA